MSEKSTRVVFLKLVSSECIITKIIEESNSQLTVCIEKTVQVVPVSATQLTFIPWIPPVVGGNVEISRSHILFEAEPSMELINQYNQIFSGIVTAKAMPVEDKPAFKLKLAE